MIDFDLSNFEKYLIVLGLGPVPGRVDGSGFPGRERDMCTIYHASVGMAHALLQVIPSESE